MEVLPVSRSIGFSSPSPTDAGHPTWFSLLPPPPWLFVRRGRSVKTPRLPKIPVMRTKFERILLIKSKCNFHAAAYYIPSLSILIRRILLLASIQTAFYKPPSHCTIPKHIDAEVIYTRHNQSPPLDNNETRTLVVASNCLDFIVFCLQIQGFVKLAAWL